MNHTQLIAKYRPLIAFLDSLTVWAMEVVDYVALDHPAELHGGVYRYQKGKWMWRIDWVGLSDRDREGRDKCEVVESIAEAWCCVLTAICEALGWEGEG